MSKVDMARREASPRELEAEAERLRAEIGLSADRLRDRLKPSHLIDEWSENNGLKGINAANIFDFAARRHPIPTTILGIGLGFLLFGRRNGHNDGTQGAGKNVAGLLGELSETATWSLRQRAQQRRDQAVEAAKSHIISATNDLSSSMEKGLEEALASTPVPSEARPLVATSAQLLIVAALEALMSAATGRRHSGYLPPR